MLNVIYQKYLGSPENPEEAVNGQAEISQHANGEVKNENGTAPNEGVNVLRLYLYQDDFLFCANGQWCYSTGSYDHHHI